LAQKTPVTWTIVNAYALRGSATMNRIRAIRVDIELLQARKRYHIKAQGIIDTQIEMLKNMVIEEKKKYRGE
jgi:hypothetical protein